MPIANLDHVFQIGLFRFVLTPQTRLVVPALNKANMLRGAFGYAFRRLCCVPECRDARACPSLQECPYRRIFEPSPTAEIGRLSKNRDIPRPFAFRAAIDGKTRFELGEDFTFNLVLIGRALECLPHFVMAFRELATDGLGLNRAKCDLTEVREARGGDFNINADFDRGDWIPKTVVYTSQDQILRRHEGLNLERWLAARVKYLEPSTRRIRVRFLSPTTLRSDDEVRQLPDFASLFKRLRDRINALSTFFGSGALDVDFAGLGRRAEQVQTLSCNVQWKRRFRTSSKTRQSHELSGFLGEAIYQGDLQEYLPWLAIGELIHVGKHTAWGMGHFRLEPSDELLTI